MSPASEFELLLPCAFQEKISCTWTGTISLFCKGACQTTHIVLHFHHLLGLGEAYQARQCLTQYMLFTERGFLGK